MGFRTYLEYTLVLIVFAAVGLLTLGYIVSSNRNARGLETAKAILESFGQNWNEKVVQQYGVSELQVQMRRMNPKKVNQLFETLSVLGPLKSIHSPHKETGGKYQGMYGSVRVREYSFDVDFEGGEAKAHIELVLIGDKWKMSRFVFDAPTLRKATGGSNLATL